MSEAGKVKTAQAQSRSAKGRVQRTKSLLDILSQEGRLLHQLGSAGQWGSESPRGQVVRAAAARYANNIMSTDRWQNTRAERGYVAADVERFTPAEYMGRKNNRR